MQSQIILTDQEKKLFNILMEVNNKYSPDMTLRVAGGWVRDKIMKGQSADIDIALDKMSGEEFAKHVIQVVYPNSEKHEHIIKKNPEKSKHLETAVISLEGYSIDLVNLRSEKYTDSSRIPIIEFGTPVEDAYRRDLTINALFYNINKNCIEDFTKLGMEDLNNKVIRTPLEPMQTFKDDPLRILRSIRFANRFKFNIAPEEALSDKVSYERIAKEMDLMLNGNCPADSINMLFDFGIIQSIFKLPETSTLYKSTAEINKRLAQSHKLSTNIIKALENESKLDKIFNVSMASNLPFYIFAAMVTPFRNLTYTLKHKQFSLVHYLLMDLLKKPHESSNKTDEMIKFIDDIPNLVATNDIAELALIVAKLEQRWDGLTLLFLLINEFSETAVAHITKANQWLKQIDIQNNYNRKPFLNGKELSAFMEIPLGKYTSKIITGAQKWQLMNPTKGKTELMDYLSTIKEATKKDYETNKIK